MAGKHQGLENKHQRLLELAKTEPLQAAIEARDDLKASKKGRAYMSTIRQLDRIINGDESAWHYGARNQTEAVQFIITNLMLKSSGLGVIPSNVRNESNIARMVGNLISEDVDFAPMTTAQKRLKMIAESYGFQVYTLNEMDDQEGVNPIGRGMTRLERFKKSVKDRGWEGEIMENTPYSTDQRTGWQILAKVHKGTARGILRLSSDGWDGWKDTPLGKKTYIQISTLDDVLGSIGGNVTESRNYTLNEMDDPAQRRYDGDQEGNAPELKVEITYEDDSRGMSVLNDGTVVLWVSEGYSDVTIIKTADGYPEHIEDIDSDADHPINRILQSSFESGQGARETMSEEMIVLWEIARNHGR